MKLSCLVVEDDPTNRIWVTQLLRLRGLEVQAVANAEAALELLHERSFDLLIVDWVLPEMDGLTLTRKVRVSHPDTIILVVTGRTEAGALEQVMASGASDYLAKPFSPRELVSRIRAVLRRTRAPAVTEAPSSELIHGPLRMNTGQHKAWVKDTCLLYTSPSPRDS